MKKALLIFSVILLIAQFGNAQTKSKKKLRVKKQTMAKSIDISSCLPAGITLETVVSTINLGFDKSTNAPKVKIIDLKQKLSEVGGKCVAGKLVDKTGKEIRFHHLQGCWGNPPADYIEILNNQTKELAELRKNFFVIELTCNPSGGLIG